MLSSLAIVAVGANAQSFTESFDVNTGYGAGASGVGTSDMTWVWQNNAVGGPGSTTWFQGNTVVFNSFAGPADGYIAANYNNSTGANNISTWLMSEVRTFSAGDTISFYTRTATGSIWPDRLRLALSLNGASTNAVDFSNVLVSVNEGLAQAGYPETWTQYSTTLTVGGTGRFAFNYNVTGGGPSGNNSNFIGIDEVAYTAVPEPATMAALGLGVAAMIRRRNRK
jgi:hypothetical protein